MNRAEKIKEVAARLSVPPSWLDSLIAFESGHNPQAVNPIPYNKHSVDAGLEPPKHARGLLQFIDASAQDLGFADSLDLVDRLPDYDSQMDGAVYPYLKRWGPYATQQSLYMAVFYPAYRKVSPLTVFSDSIQAVNPGIVTVQDYIDRVNTVAMARRIVPLASGGMIVLAAGAMLYLFIKG